MGALGPQRASAGTGSAFQLRPEDRVCREGRHVCPAQHRGRGESNGWICALAAETQPGPRGGVDRLRDAGAAVRHGNHRPWLPGCCRPGSCPMLPLLLTVRDANGAEQLAGCDWAASAWAQRVPASRDGAFGAPGSQLDSPACGLSERERKPPLREFSYCL